MIRLYTFVGCRGPYSPDPLRRFAPDFLSGFFIFPNATIILVTTDSSPSPDYQSEMNLAHKILSREIHSAPSRATGCRLEPSHVSNEEILPHSAQRMPLQRLLCNVPVANEFHCRERSANSPVGFCSEQPPVGSMIMFYLIRAISKQPSGLLQRAAALRRYDNVLP